MLSPWFAEDLSIGNGGATTWMEHIHTAGTKQSFIRFERNFKGIDLTSWAHRRGDHVRYASLATRVESRWHYFGSIIPFRVPGRIVLGSRYTVKRSGNVEENIFIGISRLQNGARRFNNLRVAEVSISRIEITKEFGVVKGAIGSNHSSQLNEMSYHLLNRRRKT